MTASHLFLRPLFIVHGAGSVRKAAPPRRSVAMNLVVVGSYNGGRDEEPHRASISSPNYQPSIWSNDSIHAMHNPYSGEAYVKRVDEVKEEVRKMLKDADVIIKQVEVIDLLERLGVSYHFGDQIERTVESIVSRHHSSTHENDSNLSATSLEFRFLRQHGYNVSSDVFEVFKEEGKFKASLGGDVKGLLHLYEASFFAIEGESILEEARRFSRGYLEKQKRDDSYISLLVAHALELTLHWRMPRMEARWFIDVYQQCQSFNPILLTFAQLDFNIVQATHQQDLKHCSSWWRDTSLGGNSEFIRDRLMENFVWTTGLLYEPEYRYFRRTLTKLNALITVVDDIYDAYGTLDELQLFTQFISRWDINEVNQLPDYMKTCFFAMHDSVHEMVAQIFKEQGVDIFPYITKEWRNLCEAYLIEAKWSNGGYVPTMEEYIENAWVSISAPLILCYAYALLSNPLKMNTTLIDQQYYVLCRCSSLILRLANDLGTSSAEVTRGDILKSVECYKHEKGCGKHEAREYVQGLINEAWKSMNKEILSTLTPSKSSNITPSKSSNRTFERVAMNLARTAQFMYQYDDGHASQNMRSQKRIQALLVSPIEVNQGN